MPEREDRTALGLEFELEDQLRGCFHAGGIQDQTIRRGGVNSISWHMTRESSSGESLRQKAKLLPSMGSKSVSIT